MEIFKMIGRLILFLTGLYLLGAGLFCGVATLFSPLWFFSLIGFGCAWIGFSLIKQTIKKEVQEYGASNTPPENDKEDGQ